MAAAERGEASFVTGNATASPADIRVAPMTPTDSLPERDVAVLAELASEGEAHVAFQGLRRRLEVHQEILARTLRRLEGGGLIARDEKGYRLTEQGFAALRGRALPLARQEVLPVIQAILPPHLDASDVSERMRHRWFRGLRWYGSAEAPGETTLTWLTESEGARVRLRIAGGQLALEVEVPKSAPKSAFVAARGILAALAELYGLPDSGGAAAVGLTAWAGVAA